jgi:hypothetical protein
MHDVCMADIENCKEAVFTVWKNVLVEQRIQHHHSMLV